MFASKPARLGLIGLATALLLLLLFYPTDAEQVRDSADAIVAAACANSAELARALEQHASSEISVQVDGLPAALVGPSALVAAALQASESGQRLAFRLEAAEVSVEGNRARLSADLISTVRAEVPELRRPRRATLVFERRTGAFRLVSAEVGAERRDQPEARP